MSNKKPYKFIIYFSWLEVTFGAALLVWAYIESLSVVPNPNDTGMFSGWDYFGVFVLSMVGFPFLVAGLSIRINKYFAGLVHILLYGFLIKINFWG